MYGFGRQTSDIENSYSTAMREIQNYLEAYGSARLNNCFRRPPGVWPLAESSSMPYASLDDYLSDPRGTRRSQIAAHPQFRQEDRDATEFECVLRASDRAADLLEMLRNANYRCMDLVGKQVTLKIAILLP